MYSFEKPIPRQLQFVSVVARRLLKSPFLYLGLAAFVIAVLLVLFLGRGSQVISATDQRNVFDDNQYLFAVGPRTGFIDLSIVEGAVLEPSAPAFLVSSRALGALMEGEIRQETEEYIVQEGDTLASLSQKFGISLETLLWANDLNKNSTLTPGKTLIVLPVSGILHLVKNGDTIAGIAKTYQANSQEIIAFNNLADEGQIFIGDLLIIPNGKKPKAPPQYQQVPLPQSYFICSIPAPCRITQGKHWYNAVDFSNGKCGDPVYAAAGGTVQKTGYGNVSGNYVQIVHPSSAVTYYGHLSSIVVKAGESVYQGQIIGYVGYTGYTIPKGPAGCHLHFDVRFAANPFTKYSVGTKLGK